MRYLLDTHTVLWFLNGERLTDETKEMITYGENYISIASFWEIAVKMNIGKFEFNGGFAKFKELVENNGFNVLPIKTEHIEKILELPLIHKDPFDRLLISVALAEGLTVVTMDENIQKYGIKWVW